MVRVDGSRFRDSSFAAWVSSCFFDTGFGLAFSEPAQGLGISDSVLFRADSGRPA